MKRLLLLLGIAVVSCGPAPRPAPTVVLEQPDAGPPPFDPAASVAAIRTLVRQQKYDEALAAARVHVAEAPEDAAGPLLVLEAQLFTDTADEAVAHIDELVAQRPDDVEVLVLHGRSLERRRRVDEAAMALQGAVEKDPDHPRALLFLGMLRRAQFENEDANKLLVHAAEVDPLEPMIWFQLAIAQNELGDNESSETSAARAVELAPDNATYWYVYGEMLRINKKGGQAGAAYERARQGPKPHPRAIGKASLVLYEDGKYDEARKLLEAAIAADGENPYLHYNLGWVLSALKEHATAIAAFERYLELASKEDGDRGKAAAEIKALRKKLDRVKSAP